MVIAVSLLHLSKFYSSPMMQTNICTLLIVHRTVVARQFQNKKEQAGVIIVSVAIDGIIKNTRIVHSLSCKSDNSLLISETEGNEKSGTALLVTSTTIQYKNNRSNV